MPATTTPPPTAELLAAHGQWLRRLAGHLLDSGPDADDVVQETWEAALRSPPDPARPPRPWLAQVMRNAIRSAGLASARRARRERAALAESEAPAPTAEEMLARMRLQEQIARLLAALEEPYRTTLLLKFYDGRDATEIARRCEVPAGTVRWRISEGLRRLRERLDGEHGDRQAWRAALLPLVGPDRPARRAPAPAAPTSWLRPLAFSAGAAALVGGALFVASATPSAQRPSAGAAARVPAAARPAGRAPGSSASTTQSDPRGETMTNENVKRAAAFLGVALPALVASADQKPDPLMEEAIGVCLQMDERMFECKEAFAEALADRHKPPPERRKALVKKALDELTQEGSAPLEERREKCARRIPRDVKPETVRAFKKGLDECGAKPDCQARAACLVPMFERARQMHGKRKP